LKNPTRYTKYHLIPINIEEVVRVSVKSGESGEEAEKKRREKISFFLSYFAPK